MKNIPEGATHKIETCKGVTYWAIDDEFGWFTFDENGNPYFPFEYSIAGIEEI